MFVLESLFKLSQTFLTFDFWVPCLFYLFPAFILIIGLRLALPHFLFLNFTSIRVGNQKIY